MGKSINLFDLINGHQKHFDALKFIFLNVFPLHEFFILFAQVEVSHTIICHS